jgi:hypothetical protein
MTPGFDRYEKRTYLSPTSLLNYARCPRLYFLKSGVRLGPREEPNYFSFGTAIHKAAPLACQGRLDEALEAFDSAWSVELNDDKGRARERVPWMLKSIHQSTRGVFEILDPPANTLPLDDRTSPWEISFAVDVGLPVPLLVRIDGRIRELTSGQVCLVDFKTSREISTRYLEGFTGSPQFLTYALAYSIGTGQPVHRVWHVAIRVSPKTTETLCNPVDVREYQSEALLQWIRETGARLLADEARQDFPMHFTGCSTIPMFGQPGYSCDFLNLCHHVPKWTDLAGMFREYPKEPIVLSER